MHQLLEKLKMFGEGSVFSFYIFSNKINVVSQIH